MKTSQHNLKESRNLANQQDLAGNGNPAGSRTLQAPDIAHGRNLAGSRAYHWQAAGTRKARGNDAKNLLFFRAA